MSRYYYIVYIHRSWLFGGDRRQTIDAQISALHPFLWLKSMNPDNRTDAGTWIILNWKEITEEEYKLIK